LPIRSPSSLASVTASGMGAGSPHVPGAGNGGSAGGGPVAAPLAVRQHGVGIGFLFEDEPPFPPALGTTAHPVEDPQLAQPLQRRGDRADADAGLAGDSLVRWIEPAGAVVEEVEDQRVQHLQRRGANGATMPARLVCAAIEVAGTVPEAHSGLLGQRGKADGLGGAVRPDRPSRLCSAACNVFSSVGRN
jgi:hypothetical protein